MSIAYNVVVLFMLKKVLIIEDDAFLGDTLIQKLKHSSYEVALSLDGIAGLKKISEWKPDLVLLDIMLPHMNGYDILEAKVKDPAIKDIPVIIISNTEQSVESSKLLSLGVKEYLVKAQFQPSEVVAKIKAELDKRD